MVRQGESRDSFAKRLGISPASLKRYEAGERKADEDFLDRLILDQKLRRSWLLTGEGEMYAEVSEGGAEGVKTSNVLEVSKSKKPQPPDFTGSYDKETSNALEVLRLAEQSLVLQRELLEVTRQNGDLRVEVERQRARIAELERQLAEALSPSGGQALLDKRNAAAG